jgi:hypothetical protein
MPTKLKREDDIDSAYDYSPTAHSLSNSENATSDAYTSAGADQAEAFANDPANKSDNLTDSVRSQENDATDANGGWTVNRSGAAPRSGGGVVKVLKKGGPVGAILGILLALAGLFSFFGGPGLLIVNLAEKMTEKFNYQLTSMDIRTNKIITAKIKNTTTGVCTPVSIKCKFASFSDKEIDNFKKAGIEVVPDENASRTLTGRTKAKSFTFEGKSISASTFSSEMKSNPTFASAVRNGYNPKFAGMSDKIASKVFAKLKISKKSPLPDNAENDDERLKAIEEQTKNGQSGEAIHHKVGDPQDPPCSNPECKYSPDDIKAEAEAAHQTGTISDAAGEVDANDTKASSEALSELSKEGIGGVSKLTSLVKVTGLADNACSIYGMMKGVSIAAKTIRMAQMARFAMIFLTTASMIKAGDAKAEDVAFLGTMLTTTFTSTNSAGKKTTTLSATDSFGYRYAAFGDKGINEAATPFLAGGGLTGKLSSMTSAVTSVLGGKKNADSTCKTLGNPIVQAGSFIGGLALMIIPGGQAISGSKIAAQVGFAALTFTAEMLLPALLADIIAGKLVDKNTVGEPAGNAIAAGSGGMMSHLGLVGGNAPLKKSQAKQLVALNRDVRLSYAKIDQATKSPFDISSPNTFMGSIASSLAPYIYNNSTSVAGQLGSLASITTSAITNFAIPKSFAEDTENFDECTDPDYVDMDIATDPFCNPVPGILSPSLNDDPNVINDRLIAQDLIDPETGAPKGEYADFVTECMDRDNPLGSTGQDSTESDGSNCFLDESDQKKGDMYVHYVDMRVNDGMENGLDFGTGASTSSTTGSSLSSATPEMCKTLAAEDLGQIACKSYQFDNYGYLWGGGHPGTASQFMTKFTSGSFTPGKDAILDCSGLVRMAIFEATGKDISGTGSDSYPGMTKFFTEVPKSQAKAGDIMWKPGHVEVIVSNNSSTSKFGTFGAHTSNTVFDRQISPSSWSYADTVKVLRFTGGA